MFTYLRWWRLLTISRIEEELGTVIYPGTEIMADVGSHHFVKSSSTSDRVLVPQPSQDPHDPLVRGISRHSDWQLE
jgi:predicted RNA binding protein YcfA (HicA-like mRNA interferase family)